jgi:hypothetical protein
VAAAAIGARWQVTVTTRSGPVERALDLAGVGLTRIVASRCRVAHRGICNRCITNCGIAHRGIGIDERSYVVTTGKHEDRNCSEETDAHARPRQGGRKSPCASSCRNPWV